MARPFVEVELNGKILNAVLDTGAWYSYIRSEFLSGCPKFPVAPREIKIGGKIFNFSEHFVVSGKVKDSDGREYSFSEFFFPVDELGEEDGKKIDIVIGSVLLESWGAKIDDSVTPPKVDFWRLRKGEMVELKEEK